MKLYIADAFTRHVFGGNPAGVVILDRNAPFPTDETMRRTAAELRYSETAFIRPMSQIPFELRDSADSLAGVFEIRYFTPAAEVDLCGHATIASFHCLREAGLVKAGHTYLNRTMAGDLLINISDDSILMEMAAPEFISSIDTPEELEVLYNIMGLHYPSDCPQAADDVLLPPEIISTGLPDIMMPIASRESLARITPDFPALSKLSEKYGVTGVHAFVPSNEDGVTAYCRNFAPLYDIDEEAATGTSSGALTYYLLRHNLAGTDSQKQTCGECLFVQGEAMGRPSQIRTSWSSDGDVSIKVGGAAAVLVQGSINL